MPWSFSNTGIGGGFGISSSGNPGGMTFVGPPTSIITTGLVLHLDAGNTQSYPGTGNTWTDLSTGKTATLVNSPTFSTSNGGSIQFNGTSQYATITSNADFALPGNFALEAWFNPTTLVGDYIPLMVVDTTNGIWFGKNTQGLGLRRYGVADVIQTANLPTANTWSHLMVSRTGTTITLYLNGSNITNVTNDTSFAQSNLNIAIDWPSSPIPARLSGRIAILRIYKGKGFTNAEYLQNFNVNRGRFGI